MFYFNVALVAFDGMKQRKTQSKRYCFDGILLILPGLRFERFQLPNVWYYATPQSNWLGRFVNGFCVWWWSAFASIWMNGWNCVCRAEKVEKKHTTFRYKDKPLRAIRNSLRSAIRNSLGSCVTLAIKLSVLGNVEMDGAIRCCKTVTRKQSSTIPESNTAKVQGPVRRAECLGVFWSWLELLPRS